MRRKTLHLLAAILVTGAGIGASGCGGSDASDAARSPGGGADPGAEAPIRVHTVRAEAGSLTEDLRSIGEVVARRQLWVSPVESGVLRTLDAQIGDRVKAGASLGQLDDDVQERQLEEGKSAAALAVARVKEAKALLRVARREVDRRRPLFERKALAANEFARIEDAVSTARAAVDVAEAQAAQARQAVRTAEQALTRRVIAAPIDGVVASEPAPVGSALSPSQPLLDLYDPDSLRLVLRIAESHLSRIEGVDHAWVEFDAWGTERATATVERIGDLVDPASRTLELDLVVLPPPGRALRPGMFGRSGLILGSATGTVVPVGALVAPKGAAAGTATATQATVWTIESGLAQPHDVLVQLRTDRQAVVDGVEPGAVVIVTAQRALKPGTPVVSLQTGASEGHP